MIPTTTHPNSVAAAKTIREAGIPKARADRRAITEYIARQEARGATDDDLARALPLIHANALRARRGECIEFGVITDQLGERRNTASGNTATVHHVTKRGLVALGLDPSSNWHADMQP